MENKMLELSYTELKAIRDDCELKLSQLRPAREIQDDMKRKLDFIHAKLTMKQFELFNWSTKELHEITKSKKILAVYSQWRELQKELMAVCDLQKLFWDARYTLNQKRLLQGPSLVHSTPLTGYDRLRANVARSMGVEANRKADRTANAQKAAIRLCK